MSAPHVRLWLETFHHQAFRIGGWAFVRQDGETVSGSVGGERTIEAERTALMGLAAALAAPAPDVEIYTTSPLLLAMPGRIEAAKAGRDAPDENLDLWARASVLLAGATLRRVEARDGTPAGFTVAWAEMAYVRAKDRGAFTAVIPKPNLAKAGV